MQVSMRRPDVLDFKALVGPINGSFVPITQQGRYKVSGLGVVATRYGGYYPDEGRAGDMDLSTNHALSSTTVPGHDRREYLPHTV